MKTCVPQSALDTIARFGTPTHTHVYMTVARSLGVITKTATLTVENIATRANLSESTVKRSIKWLEDRELVLSERVGRSGGKVYSLPGADPRQVTGDLSQEATEPRQVTSDLSGPDLRQVTHDLSQNSEAGLKMLDDLGECEDLNPVGDSPASIVHSMDDGGITYTSTRNYESRGTNVPLLSACGVQRTLGEGANFPGVLLGRDPDLPPTQAPKQRSKTSRGKRVSPTFDLLAFWNLQARKVRAVPVTSDRDRQIFLAQVKRVLGAGVTPEGVKEMILDFFQLDRHREHPAPHMVFFSKETQRTLMRSSRPVAVSNSVLSWIARGFIREDEALPWSEDFDHQFRSIAQRRAMAVMYRYPEVVAEIAKVTADDPARATEMLSSAQDLILARLDGRSDEAQRMILALTESGVTLPADLVLSRASLRDEAMTLQEAVLIASAYN